MRLRRALDWCLFPFCLFIGSLGILVPLAVMASLIIGLYYYVTYPFIPPGALLPIDICRGAWS